MLCALYCGKENSSVRRTYAVKLSMSSQVEKLKNKTNLSLPRAAYTSVYYYDQMNYIKEEYAIIE